MFLGVPWQDQYYGRYAHKYGAPVTDVRYETFLFIISSFYSYFSVDTLFWAC